MGSEDLGPLLIVDRPALLPGLSEKPFLSVIIFLLNRPFQLYVTR